MSIQKIVGILSELTFRCAEVHKLRMGWYAAFESETGIGDLQCREYTALSLPAMMVQHGNNTFVVLCRMSVWYKRKVADKSKDISKADRRRWQDLLDMVEFNINYMKAHRRECDDFLDLVYIYKREYHV